MNGGSLLVRALVRCYGAILWLFPRWFRRDSGAEMQRTFADLLLRARASGAWATGRLLAATLRDVALNAAGIRIERLRARGATPRPTGTSTRHGGGPAMGSGSRRPSTSLSGPLADLRFGFRALCHEPGLALVVVLSLAIGIGGTTLIYSVVDGVLLRALPYAEDHALLLVRAVDEQGRSRWSSYPDYRDWAGAASLAAVGAATHPFAMTVLGGQEPLRVEVVGVTPGYWQMLGVAPAAGRLPTPPDHDQAAPRVAVISESLWRNQLGAAPLGELELGLGDTLFRVIGVLPAGAELLTGGELWYPLEPSSQVSLEVRGNAWLRVVARADRDQPREGVQAELRAIAVRSNAELPPEVAVASVQLTPVRQVLLGDSTAPLALLLAASGLVLLLVCTNVTSVLMARNARRGAELTVRVALGAGRARLIRQLLSEGALLVAAGAGTGLLGAALALRLMRTVEGSPLPRVADVALDGTALLFTLVVGAVAILATALLPALLATRGAGMAGGTVVDARVDGPTNAWPVLVAVEVAIAVVVILSAGLILDGLRDVLNRPVGFRTDNTLAVQFAPPSARFDTEAAMATYLSEMMTELETLPGVAAVGLASQTPFDAGNYQGPFFLESGERAATVVGYRVVGGDYFATLGIALLSGRLFDAADDGGSEHVVVINESLARRQWPGQDPIGRVFQMRGMDMHSGEPLRVIGVVAEARHWAWAEGSQPELYVWSAQRPFVASLKTVLTLAPEANAGDLAGAVRARLRQFDPAVPFELATLADRLDATVVDRRFVASLLSGFAIVAWLLAAVGIYGVVGYSLASRRHEFGVRLALGATAARLRRLLLGGVGKPVLIGVSLGLGAAAASGGLIQRLAYGVAPFESASAVVPAILLLVAGALLGCWPSLRRIAGIDPVDAIRNDQR